MAGRNEIELLIKAKDEASRALDGVNRKVRDLEGAAGPAAGALGNVETGAAGAGAVVSVMTVAVVAGAAALASFYSIAQKGLKSIDDLRLAQASMASAAASNDPNKPWEEVYATTGKIVEKVYELDRAFIGTGDELLILSDSMVTFGMGIDLSTKKQQDQFVAFANMIKMMTRGQDFQRQAFQEVRSLMEGADVQGALLVKKLAAAGVNVKAMVPEWREQGVLLEKIMEILPGYEKGSKEVEKTLLAQKSSLETITFKILREAMAPAYEDIAGFVKKINDSLMDQNGLTERGLAIVELLQLGWNSIKTVALAVYDVFSWIDDRLSSIAAKWSKIIQESGSFTAPIEGVWSAPDLAPSEAIRQAKIAQGDWSAAMAAEMGYEAAGGGLKLAPGKKLGEGEEDKAARRAREKLERDMLRGTAAHYAAEGKIIHEALAAEMGFTQEYYDTTAKLRMKDFEDWKKLQGWMEDFNIRLQAIREEANVPVKWPWNEEEVERLSRFASESEKYAERIRKLNKEFAQASIGEGPPMTQEQYVALFDSYTEAHARAMEKIREETDETTRSVATAWAELFSGLQGEISDVFFDAFKGKLDSLGDYMEAFTDIVRRAWANLISDMITEQLKLSFGGAAKGAFGSLAGLFSSGGSYSSLAMDSAHAGMYGLKDGGVLPGGFMPIRAFASGGIADRPTFGIVGEGGESEAVIPLKGGKVPVEMRGGSSKASINFTIVAADTKDMDRLLMDRRSLIVGMVSDGMRNASSLRDSMRRSM
jgi:hypothetical protein